MSIETRMTVDEALRLADQVSPLPQVAHEALQALKREVLLRWEQRTALSFRLQDLQSALKDTDLPDDSDLYLALHDVAATAEAWMEPRTLSDAARAHLASLKQQAVDWLPIDTAPHDGSVVLVGSRAWADPVPAVASYDVTISGWVVFDTDGDVLSPDPTHWQPLKPLPSD